MNTENLQVPHAVCLCNEEPSLNPICMSVLGGTLFQSHMYVCLC